MLTPEQRASLNEAYWHSKRSITDLRREFDLTESALHKEVEPQPSGGTCWFCREPLTYANRRDRNEAQREYGRVHCRCGARQPKLPPELAGRTLRASDATIVVPLFDAQHERDWRWSPSRFRRSDRETYVRSGSEQACDAIEALAMVGLSWSGTFHAIEWDADPRLVVEELAASPTRTIVLPSVTHAMANEGDSLALFFALVQRGWRVISARDARLMHEDDGWYLPPRTAWDGLAPAWQRSSEQPPGTQPADAAAGRRGAHLRSVALGPAG